MNRRVTVHSCDNRQCGENKKKKMRRRRRRQLSYFLTLLNPRREKCVAFVRP